MHLDSFKNTFHQFYNKIVNLPDKIKFLDELCVFYSTYPSIMDVQFDLLYKDLVEEKDRKRDSLPFETVYRFEEKCKSEIDDLRKSIKEETTLVVDFILEERFKLTK